MIKAVIVLVLMTAFTFVMWENLEEKASVFFLGKTIFENAPVLLIIMVSMLSGMLLMFPLMWLHRLNAFSRRKAKASKKSTAQNNQDKKATADTPPDIEEVKAQLL